MLKEVLLILVKLILMVAYIGIFLAGLLVIVGIMEIFGLFQYMSEPEAKMFEMAIWIGVIAFALNSMYND